MADVTDLDVRQLIIDAANRAWRTFLQGMSIDIAVAIAAFVLANLDAVSNGAALAAFSVALAKTVAMTAASYVMRRRLDSSSKVPTPLPPSDPVFRQL